MKSGIRSKKFLVVSALVVLLIFAAAQAVSAAGLGGCRGMGFGIFGGGPPEGKGPQGQSAGSGEPPADGDVKVDLYEELNLTDDQVEEIKGILENAYGEVRDLRIELMDLEFELGLLRLDGDEDAVQQKLDEIKEVRDKIQEISADAHNDIKNVLTDEQIEKLDSLRPRGNNGCSGNGNGYGKGRSSSSSAANVSLR